MARHSTMNISLTPTLDRFVRSRVRDGKYESASELIRESLRALQEREQASAAFWTDLRDLLKEPKPESLARARKAIALRYRGTTGEQAETSIKAYYQRNATRERELCREWAELDGTWPE